MREVRERERGVCVRDDAAEAPDGPEGGGVVCGAWGQRDHKGVGRTGRGQGLPTWFGLNRQTGFGVSVMHVRDCGGTRTHRRRSPLHGGMIMRA